MKRTIYIGTYTQNDPGNPGESHRKEGIFLYHFDTDSGHLKLVSEVESGPNPSFLTIDPTGKFLYAANELDESQASAFAIDHGDDQLMFLNRQPTRGMATCYLSLDPTGRWLMAANYSSGDFTVLPVQKDGRLGSLSDLAKHQGKGPHPHQDSPHGHSILTAPGGNFTLAADLGLDRVWIYRLDDAQGRLLSNDPLAGMAKPGAGPRHMAFHPTGKVVYVANELDSTVSIYDWDAGAGLLTRREDLSTLPDGYKETSWVADIHMHPNGRFLYVSNRGHDSLAAFAVDAETGGLEYTDCYSTQGKYPRNFAISPEGNFILAANQNSDTVTVLHVDKATGKLESTGEMISIPRPVCVIFR